MKQAFYLSFLLLITQLSFSSINLNSHESIKPEKKHEKISALIERFIERSHYNHTKIDDELSSKIFSKYIEDLDENRSYFTVTEIQNFEKYRYKIDDMKASSINGSIKATIIISTKAVIALIHNAKKAVTRCNTPLKNCIYISYSPNRLQHQHHCPKK